MKFAKNIVAFIALLASLTGVASGQAVRYVTVTNYVTVTITNIVVITNATVGPVSITAPVVVRPGKTTRYAWNNSVSAGLTLVRGNSDITLVSADYQATKKTPTDEYAIASGLGYGEQDSKLTADNYKASFQWNHLFTSRFYGYLRTDGLRDYIADVNYRFTLGPGLGYYFVKETNTTLSVESGVNYEAEDLGNSYNTFATVRLADKFEHKINGHARFWQSVEIFPQVDRWDNYVVNFEIGTEASFTKSWSLKTYLDDNYNNRPAADRVKNDVKLVAGVAYKF